MKYRRITVFLRALLAFMILPLNVAGLIPLILAYTDPWRGKCIPMAGIPVIIAGLLILLWCIRDFYVAGKGTLAPWEPPKHLVKTGLYRYSRNPMYIGVLTLIGGWALLTASPLIACYLLTFSAIFHLRVVLYEEPCLSKMFGKQWEDYCAVTPRWLSRPSNLKEENQNP